MKRIPFPLIQFILYLEFNSAKVFLALDFLENSLGNLLSPIFF